jgi:trimethylamine--corrinoid protein Co-methyltransferase
MAHAITPGLPILNQNTPSVADMHTLASTTGGPEAGLIRQTVLLLSQYLKIPGCAHGHSSSAYNDYQSGEEKAINSLLLAAARPSLLGGLGAMANSMVTSYETLLLDNERYGAIYRILHGVDVDEDSLAGGLIGELASAKSFLESEHTLKHLQGGEVWRPRLAVRQGLVNGKSPQETSLKKAHDMAGKLLASHEVSPLPASIQTDVEQILMDYDRSHSG